MSELLGLPPLSLYIHLPWCVRKCPYCDFNSHALKNALPETEYVNTLLADLEQLLPLVWNRPVHSIFFGGGTPSLFSGKALQDLLNGVRSRIQLQPHAEITLEANPGTVEYDSFAGYVDAGINRVSLGAQSFNNDSLQRLGRIHQAGEIGTAISNIRKAGIDNLNIDIMFALPEQSLAQAVSDIQQAIAHSPTHLSHYQLTLEPNTAFAANPPILPEHDLAADMQSACAELLNAAGFDPYEISAWSQPDKACRHNLNYWQFGDYLGIGAGAHGKLSLPAEQQIIRYARQRHPKIYLTSTTTGNWNAEYRVLDDANLIFEYFLNRLRLREPIKLEQFEQRTGLQRDIIKDQIGTAVDKGLLQQTAEQLCITDLGWRFVNDLQALFLPAEDNS